jgi:hypothetical protein
VSVRWWCCRTRLLAGAVTYAPNPLEPPGDEEDVLLCCARPTTEVILDL